MVINMHLGNVAAIDGAAYSWMLGQVWGRSGVNYFENANNAGGSQCVYLAATSRTRVRFLSPARQQRDDRPNGSG